MSDNLDVSELQMATTIGLTTIATAALYSYEYVVTLDQEISHIWAKKWRLSTFIFAVNRYVTFVVAILMLLPIPNYAAVPHHILTNFNQPSCVRIVRVGNTFDLLQYVVTALFSGLRVYALSNYNVLLFAIVFALSVVPFGVNMMLGIRGAILYDVGPFFGSVCTQYDFGLSEATVLRLSLSTRIAVIVADLIVLAVTWYKTAGTVREAYRLRIRAPIGEILLRDGTLIFLGLLCINVLEVLANNLPSLRSVYTGASVLQILPPLLISRFMLNLRQVDGNLESSRFDGCETTHRSTIRFNASVIVGNMGESLQFGEQNHDDGLELEEDKNIAVPSSEISALPDGTSIHHVGVETEVT